MASDRTWLGDEAATSHVVPHLCGDAPDPAAIRRINWELAPFYCRADWNTLVIFDEGLYDRTEGICSVGPRRTVDD